MVKESTVSTLNNPKPYPARKTFPNNQKACRLPSVDFVDKSMMNQSDALTTSQGPKPKGGELGLC